MVRYLELTLYSSKITDVKYTFISTQPFTSLLFTNSIRYNNNNDNKLNQLLIILQKNMNNKRLNIALLTGAILGIFCIIGITVRLGFEGNELFILATWVNRVVIGLVIGLASSYIIKDNLKNILLRGAMLGFIISGSFYLATNFYDTPGFFMGVIYGMIIDYMATKYAK